MAKIFLAIATINKWQITHLDVNNAFLNGGFFDEIFMDLPLGYANIAKLIHRGEIGK